jgi:hypothetical protein
MCSSSALRVVETAILGLPLFYSQDCLVVNPGWRSW